MGLVTVSRSFEMQPEAGDQMRDDEKGEKEDGYDGSQPSGLSQLRTSRPESSRFQLYQTLH